MNVPGFAIPCKPPLLPVSVDLLPGGLLISQGLSRVQLDADGLGGLLNVMGFVALLQFAPPPVNAPSTEIIQ